MVGKNISSSEKSERGEFFVALVGPTGTDLDAVVEALEAEIRSLRYSVEVIRLSQLLEPFPAYKKPSSTFEDDKTTAYMDAGDAFRRECGYGGAVAALGIGEVTNRRAKLLGGDDDDKIVDLETAYIFRSLKHQDEVEVLRHVYGPLLSVISVYDSEKRRRRRLRLKIEVSGRNRRRSRRAANKLIRRDERGAGKDGLGQNVGKTFHLADFFLDAAGDLRAQCRRVVRLLFGDYWQSPTRDEYAMAVAQVVARRSADLSRQVGAVLVDDVGEIIAAGCNEVPKPGGGVYWGGDAPDLRDIARGTDENELMGQEILREIFEGLSEKKWLKAKFRRKAPRKLVRLAKETSVLEGARVSGLIEFGRVVHAEMNALAYAAAQGVKVRGTRLYCTTFPCHVCARHLLAAGVTEVIYIEPYPKSLAEQLYPQAIVRGDAARVDRLVFRPFTGLSPRAYLELFAFGKRKDPAGFAVPFDAGKAKLRARTPLLNYRTLEDASFLELTGLLRHRKWL